MDTHITRGTTASIAVDFSDITDFTVAQITAVAFMVKQRGRVDEYGLSDMIVGENTLTYHWSQEQTLAMRSGERITLDLHVTANGERYKIKGIPERVEVVNTLKNEVM